MKKTFCAFLAFLLAALPALAGFSGSTPAAGESYFLYNLYQSKFLSDDNTLGGTPVAVTPASTTEMTVSGRAYTIVTADEGFHLTYTDGDTTMALMFGAGTACTDADISSGFNADKALWLFVSQSEYAAYTEKKRFKFAALNVDGMPQSVSILGVYELTLNSDAKEEDGATAIGAKVAGMGFDVVGLSEDFNYHDELMTALQAANPDYACTTHRGKISVTASTYVKFLSSSTLFDTDGLGLLYDTTSTTASEESWTAWNEHNGYTDDGADGLIDKGFRYYLITLADGTGIDLYILHMDAETTDEDLAARESQLTQLASAIIASDNKRPIIVMGDTNCRYTRDRLKSLFVNVLDADPRFTVTDPWVVYGRQGIYPAYGTSSLMVGTQDDGSDGLGYRKGEVVDKLFLINNSESDIRLTAESYAQDLSFVDDDGEPLADHWPCVVEFSYHDYDPAVDDAVDDSSLSGQTFYLKNAATGYFLKSGGWWGTHAVQGVYGQPITLGELSDGTYVLQTPIGYVAGTDPYMDAADYTAWTLLQGSDGCVFSNGGVALTANDATTFGYGPNTRYVTTAALDITDLNQQWELVTSDDILSDARFATEDNPINLTHLLPGANFDRNDTENILSWNGWPTTATKMTYNYADGTVNIEQGNFVAEVYVESYSGVTTYGTTWDICQTLTVPNGHFTMTAQAFQRIADKLDNANVNLSLYANADSTQVQDISTATCTSAIGSTTSGSYYYPNSMAEAALFFNAGYYESSVETEVTDETLTLGIRKTWSTKSSNVWTCFDNFQLLYYPATSLTRGDMNEDGEVDVHDVALLIDCINGGGEWDEGIADVDGNHVVDYRDVEALRDRILGK